MIKERDEGRCRGVDRMAAWLRDDVDGDVCWWMPLQIGWGGQKMTAGQSRDASAVVIACGSVQCDTLTVECVGSFLEPQVCVWAPRSDSPVHGTSIR